VLKALSELREASEISLESVQQVHRTLFADVYPWAGDDRSQNASDLHITKGAVDFQLAPYVPHGVDHALANSPTPIPSLMGMAGPSRRLFQNFQDVPASTLPGRKPQSRTT